MRFFKSTWAVALASVLAALPAGAQAQAPKSSEAAAPSTGMMAAPRAAPGSGDESTSRAVPREVSMDDPPTAAPSAAPPAGPTTALDGATYAVRLRDLEQRIDDVKEQIRRSHTRLSLLSETILSAGGTGSRANIRFVNELSSAFRISRALFVLDGAVQYNKVDQSGALAEQAEIPIFSGSIPPGDHSVQILVTLQGNGYGVFSYLRGYKFEVRSSHSFTAVEGKTVDLQVVGYEKGGVTTELAERPAIRYIEKASAPVAEGAPSSSAGAK